MLIYLGICAVLCFVGAVIAGVSGSVPPASTFGFAEGRDALISLSLSPAAIFHIAFAGGAMPLVFGAVIHFVPVLTRSATPRGLLPWLPVPVQLAGLATALALGGVLPYWSLHAAATVVSLSALVMVVWIARRLRMTLGAPHPGARWYGAAMLCLFFAVSLVPVWLAKPELRTLLRLFHLHLNPLGFIGLAALGTLPVLLPTALGQPDPQAALFLRTKLLPAAAGVLLLAAGAGGALWLAVPGALLLGWMALHLLLHWWRTFKIPKVDAGGTLPLLAATMGYVLLLLFGLLHAFGLLAPRPALAGYLGLFLLPLVTGALAQLLPVWRFPGPATARRVLWHAQLGRWARLRVVLFATGGVALTFDQVWGWLSLLAGLALFVAVLLQAFWLDRAGASDDNRRPV